jgi:hypothetical protein
MDSNHALTVPGGAHRGGARGEAPVGDLHCERRAGWTMRRVQRRRLGWVLNRTELNWIKLLPEGEQLYLPGSLGLYGAVGRPAAPPRTLQGVHRGQPADTPRSAAAHRRRLLLPSLACCGRAGGARARPGGGAATWDSMTCANEPEHEQER